LLGQRQRGEFLYLRPAFDGGKDKDWPMSRVVPITTSQTESRIRGYVAAGDIELSKHDVEAIDKEGKRSELFNIGQPSTWTPASAARFIGVIALTVVLINVFQGMNKL
jgi:hypothetical protein